MTTIDYDGQATGYAGPGQPYPQQPQYAPAQPEVYAPREMDPRTDPEVRHHVLRYGSEEFYCRNRLPLGTLIRYADSDLKSLLHVLKKLVSAEDHDRLFETIDAVEDECETEEEIEDRIIGPITTLLGSYADRPTGRRSSSQGGRKSIDRR